MNRSVSMDGRSCSHECYVTAVDVKPPCKQVCRVANAPPSVLRRLFAERVRTQRRLAALSQEELADRAGVHRTYVGQVERGEVNISIDNIARISAALELPAFELLKAAGAKAGPSTL